jgi:ribonuclease P protein subunit RPR2
LKYSNVYKPEHQNTQEPVYHRGIDLKHPKDTKKIALERIEILMQRAEEVFTQDKEKANRYVQLARKIAMRHTTKFPKKWKRRICKRCNVFLKPGINCRIRTQKTKVVITCLECKNIMRIPFIKEKGGLK